MSDPDASLVAAKMGVLYSLTNASLLLHGKDGLNLAVMANYGLECFCGVVVENCQPTVMAVKNVGKSQIATFFTTKDSPYRKTFDRE